MTYLKTIRNQLGIPLQAFATLTNCKQSQLSMAEAGERSLPTSSSPFLAALEMAIVQTNNSSSNEQPKSIPLQVWLNKQLKRMASKKARLLLEQERTTEKMVQIQKLLQVAPLLETNPLFNIDEQAGLQLQILKRKAGQKQQQLQLQLAKLEINIAALEAGIDKCKNAEQMNVKVKLTIAFRSFTFPVLHLSFL